MLSLRYAGATLGTPPAVRTMQKCDYLAVRDDSYHDTSNIPMLVCCRRAQILWLLSRALDPPERPHWGPPSALPSGSSSSFVTEPLTTTLSMCTAH